MVGKFHIFLIISVLLISVLCVIPADAARIRGAIYDNYYNPIEKSVVAINTTPQQIRVSNYGGYYFDVNPGVYEITVTLTKNGITREIARDRINISEEGDFQKDLFVYDDFDMVREFDDRLSLRVKRFFSDNLEFFIFILLALSVGALLFLGVYWYRGRLKHKIVPLVIEQPSEVLVVQTPSTPTVLVTQESPATVDDAIKKKILSLLASKPLTQKDIRKEFSCSEAKISMVISELESEGLIQKKKQGRQNLISLK